MKGHAVKEMRDAIDTIPGNLESFFDRVFERLDPSRERELRRMLKWVLFAKWPLTLSEFRYAIPIGSGLEAGREFGSSEATEGSDNVIEISRMEHELRDMCGGLLELVKVINNQESEDGDSEASEGDSEEDRNDEGGRVKTRVGRGEVRRESITTTSDNVWFS